MTFGEKLKEAINIDEYELSGKCRDKKDAACLSKNHDATAIYSLRRQKKMSKVEWLIDLFVQPGVVNALDQFSESASFYLVEKLEKQFLVKITKEFVITNELAEHVDIRKFVIGNYRYKKCYRIL